MAFPQQLRQGGNLTSILNTMNVLINRMGSNNTDSETAHSTLGGRLVKFHVTKNPSAIKDEITIRIRFK
jgi:hypothetical protein